MNTAQNGMPLVSIIITTYNYATVLPRAINSALAQTYRNIEVLVCDNASTDATAEIMQAYAQDGRVRYLRHAENIGSAANHNFGGAHAHGDFFVFLSADDMLFPHHVGRGLAFLLEHPHIDVAHSAIALMDLDGTKIRALQRSGELPGTYAGARNEFASQLAYSGYMCVTTMLISREIWQTHGPFVTGITAIDYEYTLRLSRRGVRIGYFPAVTAAIAIHADSVSGSDGYLRSGDDVRDFLKLIAHYALSHRADIHGYEYAIIRHLESKWERCVINGMPESAELRDNVAAHIGALHAIAEQPSTARPARFAFVLLADQPYDYVIATIRSILAQSDEAWTLTVIVPFGADCSEVFSSLDPRGRIHILRLSEAMTAARAVNFGILRTDADAVRILRAGSVLDESALFATRAVFDAQTTPLVIASHVSRAVRVNDEVFATNEPAADVLQDAFAKHGDFLFAAAPLFPTEAFTIARRLLDRMYFFDESLHALFFWEFLLRAGANSRAAFAESTIVLDAGLLAQPGYAEAIAADTQRIHRLYPVQQPEIVARRGAFRRAIETVRGEFVNTQATQSTVGLATQAVAERNRRLFMPSES